MAMREPDLNETVVAAVVKGRTILFFLSFSLLSDGERKKDARVTGQSDARVRRMKVYAL